MKVYCEDCNKVIDENNGEYIEYCPYCGGYNSCYEGDKTNNQLT